MPKLPPEDKKTSELREQNALNLHPKGVQDPLFESNPFFDPRDLVQVKYEMLRRVLTEGRPIGQAASDFGFSRPSYYEVQAAFTAHGLPGLMPRKKGPRRAHKLSPDVLAFIVQRRKSEPGLSVPGLIALVQEQFAISLHRRTIERALSRKKNC
jgi:transposase